MTSYLVWDGSGGYLGHYGEKLKNEIEADKYAVGYTIVPRHHAKLATRMLEAAVRYFELTERHARKYPSHFVAEDLEEELHWATVGLRDLISEARAQGGSDE